MSAKMYNLILPEEKCNFAKVLTVKGVVPSRFPHNPAAFWSMSGENELVELCFISKLLIKSTVRKLILQIQLWSKYLMITTYLIRILRMSSSAWRS